MHQQAGRLVDGDHLLVAVEDVEHGRTVPVRLRIMPEGAASGYEGRIPCP
jgi:hypothetical protein